MQPLIGITGRRFPATRVSGLSRAMLLTQTDIHFATYSAKVAAAGGLPVQLSMDADPVGLARRLDGIVFSGGADVDPLRYGGKVAPNMTEIEPERDAFELALVGAALEERTPILGICRGTQLLNVFRGGTLVPDLPESSGEAHPTTKWPANVRRHRITFVPGTVLASLYGNEVFTNSLHHQAVAEPGAGVNVAGRADDGVVEAIEYEGHDVIAVQWHPELLDELEPVFDWIVEQARAHAKER
jgi:putative glutamine amidotransferase